MSSLLLLSSLPSPAWLAQAAGAPDLPVELLRTFWVVVAGVMGLLWGSFFNVCIYRVPAGLSVVAPRSYCYTCGTMVAARDNIPVVSWLLLGGCCRHCGTPIAARYTLIELMTGVLFAAIAWRFFGDQGPTAAMIGYMVFAGFLIVATFTDIDHFIIPDGVSLGSGAAGVGVAGVAGALAQAGLMEGGLIAPIAVGWPFEALPVLGRGDVVGAMANAALGGAFAAGMLYGVGVVGKLVFQREAMGFGDVKLMVGIGAFLGVVHSVVAFFAACVLGAVISLSWMGAQWLSGRRGGPLGEEFPPVDGPLQRALDAAASGGGAASVVAAPASGGAEDALAGAPEAAPADMPAAPVVPWSREGLGRAFARAAREPRPYAFRHLPFGPYLALGALLVLFAHARITQEANLILSVLELRREVPVRITVVPASGGAGAGAARR